MGAGREGQIWARVRGFPVALSASRRSRYWEVIARPLPNQDRARTADSRATSPKQRVSQYKSASSRVKGRDSPLRPTAWKRVPRDFGRTGQRIEGKEGSLARDCRKRDCLPIGRPVRVMQASQVRPGHRRSSQVIAGHRRSLQVIAGGSLSALQGIDLAGRAMGRVRERGGMAFSRGRAISRDALAGRQIPIGKPGD